MTIIKSHYADEIILYKNGEEIIGKRNPGSVIDPVGCVVEADGKIYRVISSWSVKYIKELLTLPDIEEIFEAGLVRTKIADVTAKDFSLVLEHERIPYQSLPTEWAPNMLIDAAKTTCNLGHLLHKKGYSYKDGNLSNLTFFYAKPVFFDIGSIVPTDSLYMEPKTFPLEFSGSFLSKLGTLLEIHTTNLTESSLFAIREKYIRDAKTFFLAIIEYLNTVEYKVPITEWAGYGGKWFDLENLNPKQRSVYDTIKNLYDNGMRTLVDVGGSKGAFTEPAADLGYECVAFDLDTTSVMVLYDRLKESGRKITPLLMNFMAMTPKISGTSSASQRLRSDVSLYLAITHHLSLGRGISLDEQAKRLDELTKHYCIVEFIPTTDIHFRGEWRKPTEYTVDGFTAAMEKYGFELVDTLPSAPDPRVILVYGR